MKKPTTALIIALALVAVAAAQSSADNAIYFDNAFLAFGSDAEAEAAIKATPSDPASVRDALLKAGNHYWMLGTKTGESASAKRANCAKAVDILERLWKKNKRDDVVCLCLGYAYMGLAGSIPLTELEALLSSINKAQNIYGMIVARLPRNIEPRLARTLINMNLTPQNGRPDALVLEDAEVYFAGYMAMGVELRSNPYYYMGAMEMRLAQALVYHDQGKKAEAKALVAEIDEAVLAPPFKALLAPLKKAYGR